MAQSSTGKKGCKKAGRNANFCKAYKLSRRREHNKVRKLKRLLRTHPNDTNIVAAIDHCMMIIRGY